MLKLNSPWNTRVFTLLFFIILSTVANSQNIDKAIPKAQDIIEETISLQVPTKGYDVKVNQTITNFGTNKIPNTVNQCSFDVKYVPGQGINKIAVVANKSANITPSPT